MSSIDSTSSDEDENENAGRTVQQPHETVSGVGRTLWQSLNTVQRRVNTLNRRTVIAARDLASLRYEKTIVLALLIQLVIAGFSSFLVVGLVSIYDSGEGATDTEIGVTGDASNLVETVAQDEDGIEYLQYRTLSAGSDGLQAGNIDGLLIVTHGSNGEIVADLRVPEGDLRTTLVVNQISEVLERIERHQREQYADSLTQPVLDLPRVPVESQYYAFTYTILVPLLIFLPVFVSGSVIVDAVTEEVERGTLELLRVAPVSFSDIVSAKVGVATLLGPGQALLWFVLLSMNGIQIGKPVSLLVLTTELTLLFVSVGVGIALAVPKRRYAQLLYSSMTLFLLGSFAVFPEHPINTIARLAVGHPQPITYGTLGLFAGFSLIVYLLVRANVSRFRTALS